MFHIWLDADSCPNAVRAVIIRAADREGIACIFVANREIPRKKSENVTMVVVPGTDGAADDYIVENSSPGDMVITPGYSPGRPAAGAAGFSFK